MDLLQCKRVFKATGIVESKVRKPRGADQKGTGDVFGVNVLGAGWRAYYSLTAELHAQCPEAGAFFEILGDVRGDGDKTYPKALAIQLLGAGGVQRDRPGA